MAEERGHQYHSIERLQRWEGYRFGMFIHFGINTYTGRPRDAFRPPVETYAPSDLSVEQWLDVAQAIGAAYAVLVTKHNTGFCLWPSALTEYSVAGSLTDRTDVVGAFVEACRSRGIRPALYYNWYDLYCGERDENGYTEAYWAYATGQVRELLTQYGELEMIWFDKGSSPGPAGVREAYDLVHELQPEILMLNNQWAQPGGTMCPGCWPEDIMNGENVFPPETGYDPWHTIDGKPYYIPMEVCYRATTRWVDAYDNEPRPLAELVETWQKSVGRGANLLLNLPPDRTGRIPEPVVERALAMSREVGRV